MSAPAHASPVAVALLRDAAIEPVPEYGPADCARALHHRRIPFRFVDAKEVEGDLSHHEVLVVCHLRGVFSAALLAALTRFHRAGGSLLFLGQLPFDRSWAPTRNFHADQLALTAYCQTGCVDDWSTAARDLLGPELPDLGAFKGRPTGYTRTTAFPPDETIMLFHSNDVNMQWQVTPGIWVQRRSREFLGAKLVQIGCTGGQPRENAAGGYPMPWTYDPGFLNRDWPGMDDLLGRLVIALAPTPWAAALEGVLVHREDEPTPVTVLLKNNSAASQCVADLDLVDEHGTIRVALDDQLLAPGETRACPLTLPPAPPGSRRLSVRQAGHLLHTLEEHVLPVTAPTLPLGFGFSTYWSFHQPHVPETFKTFCRQLQQRGCRYVRVNIPWEDIEPEPGKYDWRVPDAYLDCAEELGLTLLFWMFPITRGATIGDGGVPAWTLKEPALTHDGRTGFFPSLWSPFYRQHFFGMVDAFTRRYAHAARLNRLVIDFGNSDFPYGYFYYVNDPTLFDYSPHERRAFATYLLTERRFTMNDISALYHASFAQADDIPVPLASAHPEAWQVYLDFRTWTIRNGLEEVRRIVKQNAPNLLPPDLPGHGSGSIADLSTYHLEAKARHWQEESGQPEALTCLHNAGPTWGGEPWQVGARYRDMDDALFQSLRLGADYFSVAGPDIGVYGNDIARLGFVRRWLQGAHRERPMLAVIDQTDWNACQSLAHIASRMDQPVDLLGSRHRHDFSCYHFLALPPNERAGRSHTGGGGSHLLPMDTEWFIALQSAIKNGLHVLCYPDTARLQQDALLQSPLRPVLGLGDVGYGERTCMDVSFPAFLGGGTARGQAREVRAPGDVVLRSTAGKALLIRRALGLGAIWLAGWDTDADSLDGNINPATTRSIQQHTLCRLVAALGVDAPRVRTHQTFVYKEWIRNETGEAFLAFSHANAPVDMEAWIRLDQPATEAMDLATGERFPVAPLGDGWCGLALRLDPAQGRYIWFRPA
jgi:hypothetical protein